MFWIFISFYMWRKLRRRKRFEAFRFHTFLILMPIVLIYSPLELFKSSFYDMCLLFWALYNKDVTSVVFSNKYFHKIMNKLFVVNKLCSNFVSRCIFCKNETKLKFDVSTWRYRQIYFFVLWYMDYLNKQFYFLFFRIASPEGKFLFSFFFFTEHFFLDFPVLNIEVQIVFYPFFHASALRAVYSIFATFSSGNWKMKQNSRKTNKREERTERWFN